MTDGSSPSRSRCTYTGPSDGTPEPTPAASTSTFSPGSRSRTPRNDTDPGSIVSGQPASQRPHAAPRHMPPRKPLGVVSGVLKSPCASIHRNRTPGTRRATVGIVAMQIEQSEAVSSGNSF